MVNSNVRNTPKDCLRLFPAFTVGTAITSASRDSILFFKIRFFFNIYNFFVATIDSGVFFFY